MVHLHFLYALDIEQMMDILLEVLTRLEPHVCVDIGPPNNVEIDHTLLSLLVFFVFQGPAIMNRECFRASDDRSHLVHGVHNSGFAGQRRRKVV